jgi:acetolactate synthase-1/2/3 large subunit
VRARGIREAEAARAEKPDAVPAAELFRALHRLLPESAICVDEIIAPMPQMLQFLYEGKPFEQFRGWMGALGTSLGTALGVKLARPQNPVVCIVGDGAWHYNPIPAALGFSQEYRVPLLLVLCNNRQYASQTWNVLRYYPDGAAVRTGNFVGNKIEPMPDYVKTVEAYGGAGERVQSIAALEPAIRRGLEVTGKGQTFLLDTVLQ